MIQAHWIGTMKLQFAIILIFALIICDLVSAESEKTSEIVGRKKFNRRGKMLGEDGKPEKRSRFPRRLSHGNGGFRTTNRPLQARLVG
ncbi:hypothetical protein GCK72_013475 [Caenorhabditis remanei]|uniref:Uncharacterized protein n=1 Tax=Caenorhabditis remanei TaxID=31234 RepID=A0A6A5GNU8_CAERE|nr:hypothetical protein GCK72_013475 [Caenorhabditis remanei]KAF1757020.1 hypothetical protein GCK72_013475 [Caenorhabditis remanei]